MKQFIVDDYPAPQPAIELSGRAFHYLIRVRRHRKGDTVELAFSNGDKIPYTVTEIDFANNIIRFTEAAKADSAKSDKQGGMRLFQHAVNSKPESFLLSPPLILLQWMLKTAKMDLVIRQATEVGVRFVLPVFGEFSVVQKQHEGKVSRYERIVKEARQQSDSPVLTEVLPACSLQNTLALLPDIISTAIKEIQRHEKISSGLHTDAEALHIVKIVCTEKAVNTSGLLPILKEPYDAAIIAIGCEGGISDTEYALLDANGFVPCHFQTNILRAETASLYALAAVQSLERELHAAQTSTIGTMIRSDNES